MYSGVPLGLSTAFRCISAAFRCISAFIPEKVLVNGTEVNDINIVLKVWKEEFHKLYNKLEEPETNMEESLYGNMLYEKQVLENNDE